MLRPLEYRDHPAVAQLLNLVRQPPGSARDKADFLTAWRAEYPASHLVAEDDAGTVIGYGTGYMASWIQAGRMRIHVVVDPRHRGRGIGSALYGEMLAFARQSGAAVVSGHILEDDPASLAWAEHRGLEARHHFFESELDLPAFDATPFAEHVERLEAEGFRFVPFSQLRTPETERRLYDLFHRMLRDMPNGADTATSSFEDWRAWVVDGPGWPEVTIIALDAGGRWVGCHPIRRPAPEVATISVLGVEPEFRGLGIGLAMKLRALDLLKAAGVQRVITNNHERNAPMLRINEKLGFRRLHGHFAFFRGV